ncbi:MAG: trypsin-like peptidase domain-containing protein [Clostridia bacterium]|nr:trypsin-like peptidase domain-containing protein [Clostridia bacterium]
MNGFNGQNDNNNGMRPDYTYNWNGSEYNRKNRGSGRGFAIVAVIVALVAILTVSFAVGYYNVSTRRDNANTESAGEYSDSGDNSAAAIKDGKKDGREKNPEFTPNTTVIKSASDLSELYANSSAACCTIKVTTGSSSGYYTIGSGFVIDSVNGYIATNHHVIENAKTITVIFYDDTKYKAELIGSDATTDLAVLRIKAEGLTALPFGDSESVQIGEQVVAIGTPYSEELAGTMTVGHVSGIARDITVSDDNGKNKKTMTLLQTDCAINPGNSGGPLIDMSGRVIGINAVKIVSEEYEGLCFAIPITSASEVFRKLIAGEEVGDSDIASATPRLGVTVYDLEYGLDSFRLSPKCDYPDGLLVGSMEGGTSVYEAGLQVYDIITEFDGAKIASLNDLSKALGSHKAGQTVTMKVFRFNRSLTEGEYVTLTFKLDAAD